MRLNCAFNKFRALPLSLGAFWGLFAATEAVNNSGVIYLHQRSRSLLQAGNIIECLPSGMDAFPADFFSQELRVRGAVIVHLFLALYTCAMIGIVCHNYFVPSLDIISKRLKLPPDIAGATFMAIGTSAPELFSSITGSFITEGDIGVGTIIGSAVFNLVGVTGLVGIILWKEVLSIEWYPIARDCLAYALTIATLIWIISDNIVTWWEALVLLLVFILYIVVLYFNAKLEIWSQRLESKQYCCCSHNSYVSLTTPLLGEENVTEIAESQPRKKLEGDSYSIEITASKEVEVLKRRRVESIIEEVVHSGEHGGSLCSSPSGGVWRLLWWLLMYPAHLLFFLTIPDSKNEGLAKFFPLTFLMSVLWIGVLSYLAVWMVTVVGYTFAIPDSVSGLTILAIGTSVPEIISSIIVAKNGFGNMAISNLVGSNTFDISFCLGAPWLLKTLVTKKGYLLVFSSALTYTTATLFFTLIAFVLVFMLFRWKLNRTVGLIFEVLYVLFVILACMYEMNVFGEINVRHC